MTEAEKLFTETFFRTLRIQGFIRALRRIGELGVEAGERTVRKDAERAIDFILGAYAIIKDMDAFVDANGPERMKRDVAELTLSQARVSIDAAALVFAHSALDAAALDYCQVTALLSPQDWEPHVEKKRFTLEEVRAKTVDQLREELLQKFFEELDRDSLLVKIDLLFQRCKPPAKWSPMQDYEYDRERMIRLDGLRHEIVHGQGPEAVVGVAQEDQEYLLSTGMFLMLLVHQHYGIKLVPEYLTLAQRDPG